MQYYFIKIFISITKETNFLQSINKIYNIILFTISCLLILPIHIVIINL